MGKGCGQSFRPGAKYERGLNTHVRKEPGEQIKEIRTVGRTKRTFPGLKVGERKLAKKVEGAKVLRVGTTR